MKRLRARSAGDDGLTIVEVVVVVMLTALVLAMVGGFFTNVMLSVTAGRTTRAATASASTALEEIARVLRTAEDNPTTGDPDPAISVGSTGTILTVLSYVDTDTTNPSPSKVRFAVDAAGNLVETRTASVLSSGNWVFTGAVSTRTFPGGGTAASGFQTGTDLFTYLDGAGAAVDPTTAPKASSIRQVQVDLTVGNRGRAGDDPVRLTTVATMPNVSLS